MNRFYIQIVFFLLSFSVYLNNETLATNPDPGMARKIKTKSKKYCDTPEEIHKQNKHLLCTNPNEITNAIKLMNEAATQLEYHAKNKEGYKLRVPYIDNNRSFSIKKHEGTIVQRTNFQYYLSSKYNEMINMLWDPALANHFNNGSVKRKIVRVYSPNLVMIQQRYKNWFGGREKYFYALAAKVDVSKNTTAIVMTSANIIDHNPSKKEYKNKIIENANLFKTEINSENDIRNKKLKKTFVNIAGYLLEKTSAYVNFTYLESIDGHTSNYQKFILEKALNKFFHYKNLSYCQSS
ncbi:fam-a protein [Plasmodium vinckei]|uniref:Fam-a protein n=1 Tax=Plasmodium vinckei TaxID=5860 RepID=A0A6V7T8X9_PLAVN|nr:fam-a protein [Plasmodium vinckei]